MAKYPPTNYLRRSRRRRSRRRGRGRRRLTFALFVALIAAGGWWWYSQRDPLAEKRVVEVNLLAAAAEVVAQSVEAARAPLRVQEAAPDLGASRRDAELAAVWTEGEDVSMRGVLQKNQSISGVLHDRNLSSQAIHAVVSATSEKFNFRRSRPGDKWFAQVNAEGDISLFRYQTSREDIWETTRSGDGTYHCEKLDVPVQTRQEVIAGVVQNSLWQAVADQGEDGSLIYNFTDMFAYTIDFNSSTQPGDRFALVFEKVYIDGAFIRYGRVLAGAYVGGDKVHYGFYHETDDDQSGYYDAAGDNLKRQFLKSPLASVRITSRYGKRFHPVLNRDKMHNGVDYGAPIGTKVRAVADGKVRFAGRKGANGILIVLDHANGYQTMYAHLSKIEKGVRPGKRVSKKTIIGRTGNTGRSTGPHLHFGMKHRGRYVNPKDVDFARGTPLKGEEKAEFIESVAKPLKKKLHRALKATGFEQTVAPAPTDTPSVSSR